MLVNQARLSSSHESCRVLVGLTGCVGMRSCSSLVSSRSDTVVSRNKEAEECSVEYGPSGCHSQRQPSRAGATLSLAEQLATKRSRLNVIGDVGLSGCRGCENA